MFKEDTRTGLTVKLSAQEKTQSQGTSKASPTKRKALGKRTGGKPKRKLQTPRGMSLQTEMEKTINEEKQYDTSTTSEENISPSPKRQNQKTNTACNRNTEVDKSLTVDISDSPRQPYPNQRNTNHKHNREETI